jgi:ATP-dependent DNA helicase RecQ
MNKRQIRRAARELLGYEALRPGQDQAIASVLGGRDTLAVMPTGWGKSAIYQISAARLPGPTLVVSPLIALQRDQVESVAAEVGGAAQVNSAISRGDRRQAFADLAAGELEFLFLSPEQLANPETLERVRAASPSLFVVDEAHCVSEWGHDFRPDYLRLGAAVEALGHPTILALTATAAPPVREEIVARLGMREPHVIVQGFDRPNIHMAVERVSQEADKQRALAAFVAEARRPGIVYVATRKRAEQVAEALRASGVEAEAYHAGMRAGDRERAQQRFMGDEAEVMVATTAFGMGIDKPNVGFVCHYDISDSIDSYYQEIGRAGRDGEPADALLLYRPEDMGIRRFFTGGGQVEAATVAEVAQTVADADGPLPLTELKEETGLPESRLTIAIHRLQDSGVLRLLPSGQVELVELPEDLAAAAEETVQAQERHRRYERSRLEMMRGYAETRDCRRRFLLNYFGEQRDEPCGYCDNCEAGRAAETPVDQPFLVGSQVRHSSWGAGQVMSYEGEKIVVLFDEVGYKTLDAALALERGLLTAEPDAA